MKKLMKKQLISQSVSERPESTDGRRPGGLDGQATSRPSAPKKPWGTRYMETPAKPGTRWGSLTVLRDAGIRVYPAGGAKRGGVQRHLRVHVRCDCGRVYDLEARRLFYGPGVRRCLYCRAKAAALRGSVRLPSGKTIVELARETGLKTDTLLHRWIRGWPESDLALPPHPQGTSRAARAPPPSTPRRNGSPRRKRPAPRRSAKSARSGSDRP